MGMGKGKGMAWGSVPGLNERGGCSITGCNASGSLYLSTGTQAPTKASVEVVEKIHRYFMTSFPTSFTQVS